MPFYAIIDSKGRDVAEGILNQGSAYVKKYVCVVEWSINCHIF